MGFKFSDMVTMNKILNWVTFPDYGSICKVKGGHYVSKLTLFAQYFLEFFLPMAFIFSYMVTMDKTLNCVIFRDYGSIFKVTEGHYISKLTLFM